MAIVFGPTQWHFHRITSPGTAYAGGTSICKSGGILWIVAPNTTEVSRTWYNRADAVTTAEANAACGDWFIPGNGQLRNPGYSCRSYWDSYVASFYWSDTAPSADRAWVVNFNSGVHHRYFMSLATNVRAFRCVTY